MEMKIIRVRGVLAMTGIGRTTLWKLCKSGDFPAPLQLSEKCIGWRVAEIQQWIESRPKAA